MDYTFSIDHTGKPYLKVKITDFALLSHALLNKGTAFPAEEREMFGLTGLLPPSETNLAIQCARSYETFQSKVSDIEKYIYLRDLQDSNETLFFSLIQSRITELMPIVYTPIVGLGCQRYSHIYRRPRGVFISYPDRHRIEQILSNPRFDEVKVIVVSDGERILGLGDQGAGGMGIPIGKLALYTACAGIPPTATLPILLDAGTNNLELQQDPLYIGWQHERVRGTDYAEFIDTFVNAVKKRFPHVLLQWEDFAQENANPLLQRYRDQLCTFNDDIQGTAAVAAGALFAAIRVTGTRLRDQRIVVLGAGSAGCGISQLIMQAMIEDGLSEQDAGKSVSLNGMLLSMLFKATPEQLRLIMIDPKMLELSIYEGIPHLLTPVITDMKDAANALRWCVAEMDRRYRLMASLGVRNLAGYNVKIADANKEGNPLPTPEWLVAMGNASPTLQSLPMIVVVVDELADMMMVVGKKVEELVTRIAQKARAAGIHLILATQRPSVDVITGLIKANIPTRIAFQVSSRIDSRTILDQQGAEQLIGNGDMLYLPPGTGVPVRVHGAYVADEEVHRVVATWQTYGKPAYLEEVTEGMSEQSNGNGENAGGEADPLYDEAIRIVTESRRASISLVQRRLRIGYNRAARIMEDMELAGVVSTMDGSGVREVLANASPE